MENLHKNKAGRKTRLTPELQAEIVGYLEQGNYIETVCALVGLHKDSFYDWLKRGAREEVGIFAAFSDAVKTAMARSEQMDLEAIRRHGSDDWKAHAWRLERRYPARWGRKDHVTAEIDSQHTERIEVLYEQRLEQDPESADLLRQLYRRQTALDV